MIHGKACDSKPLFFLLIVYFYIDIVNLFGYIMLILISYDIEDDRTRTRLAHKLKDFGPRVQKSVFEADLELSELKRLHKLLDKVKLLENDSIRVYQICSDCSRKITIWGLGEVTKDKDFYIA